MFAGASGSTEYRVDSTTETAQTGDGWSIGDISMARESGVWVTTTIGPAKFAVLGAEIALQETATTLVTNLDPAGTGGLAVSTLKRANSFTTAARPWVRYEFSGIRFRAARAITSSRPTPLVTVHRDDGGRPATDPLYTLDAPSDFLSVEDILHRTYTFTARPGAILYAGATYWLVFDIEAGGYQVRVTTGTAETGPGWQIGDQSRFAVAPPDWRVSSSGSAQFAVLGTEIDLLATETCTVDTSNPGTAVNILDDRLRAVVEAKLGKSSGATITRGEMAGLTSLLNTHNKDLRPPHAQITDMEGLQYATGLTHLSLQRHRIDNAGLIDFCALTKLTELFLDNNQLTSITIPSLPRLTSLSLSSNRLDSVTILYTPELTYLDLSSNHLSRVIIPPQPKLLTLLLGRNRLTSFTIPSLPELIYLDIDHNQLTSIAIPRLPNLNRLDMSHNQLSRVDLVNLGYLFAVLDVRNNGSVSVVNVKGDVAVCGADGSTADNASTWCGTND